VDAVITKPMFLVVADKADIRIMGRPEGQLGAARKQFLWTVPDAEHVSTEHEIELRSLGDARHFLRILKIECRVRPTVVAAPGRLVLSGGMHQHAQLHHPLALRSGLMLGHQFSSPS